MAKKKILIVDDNEDVSKGLRIFFRAHDFTTILASDAVAAISQAKNENPDLIVLDLGLPAGDGFVVMERLSNIESVASIPVIVFSARDEQGHKERSLQAGAKAFFQKPVDPAVLLSAIQQVLESPGHLPHSAA
ncbi:MAG TPA: response regulator transcription factor [Candidatus Binatia bacterium]|jgi:DNA-binding response OmpR family regulator